MGSNLWNNPDYNYTVFSSYVSSLYDGYDGEFEEYCRVCLSNNMF